MNQQQSLAEIDPAEQPEPVEPQSTRLRLGDAYIKERTNLEVVEIELNRSKILVIDEQGRKRRVPILSEH